jgi:hypothetical protein
MDITGTTHNLATTHPHAVGLGLGITPEAVSDHPTSSEDQVSISGEEQGHLHAAAQGNESSTPSFDSPAKGTQDSQQLSEKEQHVVEELRKRDREVRSHEQAHLAAAGSLASGGPTLTYQVGPDGKRYAVGGEVPIAASEVPGDPRATLPSN